MVRTQLYRTEAQHALLRARAARHARTLSDEVREAVDASFADELAERERLRTLRLRWVADARHNGPAWKRREGEDVAALVEPMRRGASSREAELDSRWHGDRSGDG